MATATTHVPRGTIPPTEAEIRELVEERIPIWEPGEHMTFDDPEWIHEALESIVDSDEALVPTRRSPHGWVDEFNPDQDHPGTVWADMQASEVKELHDALSRVRAAALRGYLIEVREGVIAATVAFAEAHPDIPRGAWRPAREDMNRQPG